MFYIEPIQHISQASELSYFLYIYSMCICKHLLRHFAHPLSINQTHLHCCKNNDDNDDDDNYRAHPIIGDDAITEIAAYLEANIFVSM